MKDYKPFIKLLKNRIDHIVSNKIGRLKVSSKTDKSFVTDLDLEISNTVKKACIESSFFDDDWSFYSEEDIGERRFPALILDPIDGTRELVHGIPECVVSLAISSDSLIEDKKNFGWLYNPFSGFEIYSKDNLNLTDKVNNENLFGFVSRTEWIRGEFKKYHNVELNFAPRGSIAFKLGALASGYCDFVLSQTTPLNEM